MGRLGRLGRLVGAFVVSVVTVLAGLALPTAASAATSEGHGYGYTWAVDNFSWLGTYRMADGRYGFCLEAGKRSPIGNDYSAVRTDLVEGTTPEQTAQLAYIARTWAATTNRDDAAAAQLAVWSITGLAGYDQEHYAARANDRAAIVLARAKAMLREAADRASIDVTARLSLQLDDSGSATIAADLVATRPGGSSTPVNAGTHQGTVTLDGATFADGSATKSIANGTRVSIKPRVAAPTTAVRADVAFRALPFGRTVLMGASPAGSQKLLFSSEGFADASATASAKALSPLPFQPRVATQTSSAEALPGSELTDSLELGLAAGDGLLGDWGLYRSADHLLPIPVTVRSRLLGPFREPIAPADDWPAEAPSVCEVATLFESGPGQRETEPCTIPSAGYYVWVETIDPADTAPDQGGDRVKPWRSPFGQATEVTFSPAQPALTTSVAETTLTPGSCAVDTLKATGLEAADSPIATDVEVESILVGPFDRRPADGADLADGFDGLPVAGRTTTTIHGDGTYSTPCLTVDTPGHYVFVFRSDGSPEDSAGHQTVPAFADLVAHDSEMLEVVAPEVPVTPPVTPAAASPAPRALAFTGSDGWQQNLLAGLGALVFGVAAVTGTVIARRVRGRHGPGSLNDEL